MGHTHERRDKRPVKRDIVFAGDGQRYACVTKMLGNCRVMVRHQDGTESVCKIRGSMHRRVYIAVGDWVLVCDRELAGSTGDVVHKYTVPEAVYLTKIGEIHSRSEVEDHDDDGIDFGDFDEGGLVHV